MELVAGSWVGDRVALVACGRVGNCWGRLAWGASCCVDACWRSVALAAGSWVGDCWSNLALVAGGSGVDCHCIMRLRGGHFLPLCGVQADSSVRQNWEYICKHTCILSDLDLVELGGSKIKKRTR